MKRMSFWLAVMAAALIVGSGSAFAAASPPVNTSLPTIGGTAREVQTLTASNGSWTGTAPISYAYRWQRCNSAGSSCSSISGATSQNYVLSHGDVGRTIRVDVTATNADGTAQALSAATASIATAGNAPVSTKQANPSGTAQDGLTVKVDDGSWSGDKPITFGYQWQSCTAVNSVCTDISGATGSSFAIGFGQVGLKLRAMITATNAVGKTSASSNMTGAVAAKLTAPVSIGLPAITGIASVGQRLQASTGTWTGVASSGFSYQWSRCNSNGSACAGISGATGQSYGVGQADLGMAIRVTVKATNANGSTSAISAATAIRIAVVQTSKYNSVLRARQEVGHPMMTMMSNAAGHFTARVTGKTLKWTLTFSHLSGRPTVTGLNRGVRGSNGVAFKTLCRRCYSGAHGTLTLTSSQLDAMKRGATYVNIHTTRNPYGEIRGQIIRVS